MQSFYPCLPPRGLLLWLIACWAFVAPRPAAAQTVIINATAAALPGDPVSLQGNFGAGARFLLASPSVSNLPLPVLVQRAGHATVQIPTSLSLDLYRVWAEDAGQRSPEVLINRARGMHFDSPEVAPGGALRLFGRNLQVPGNAAQVRFQAQGGGAGSGMAQVDAGHSDAYQLALTAPAGLQPGVVYDVFVRNGLGGGNGEVQAEQSVRAIAGGSDAFVLGVPWAPLFNFSQNVYNVRTGTNLAQHATGNGQVNDQPAIQAAINAAAAAGGGVVYLPAGTYRIDYPTGSKSPGVLSMRSRVVLRGDGPQTIIRYGYAFDNTIQYWTLFFDNATNLAGLADLMLVNMDASGRVPNALSYNQTSRLFLKNVVWDLAVGEGINLMNVTELAIRGCTIRQGVSEHNGPLRLDGSTDVLVKGNRVTYAVDGLNLNYTQRVVFENNRVYRDGSARYPTAVTNHVLVLNFAENLAVLGNRLQVINGPAQNKNDGESIIAEGGGGGGARLEAAGTVIAAKGTTLQGTQAWGQLGARPVVAIVKGPGMGQWRYLQAPTPGSTLTVTKAWDVVPAPTATDSSRYSVFSWGSRNWLIQGDTLQDNKRGITLYGNATTDVAIVGNVLRNSGSIDLMPSQQVTTGSTGPVQEFLPMYNNQIVGNIVTADAGALSGVFIGAHTSQYVQAKTFGTSVIGLEVRRNTLQGAGKPAEVDANFPEGYLNYLQYQPVGPYIDQQVPAVLGSIFQNNTARNCQQAVHLNTGSYDTFVCGTSVDATTALLDDATIDGTGHASVGTTSCMATATAALYRVNAGGGAVTNAIGTFAADQYFTGGATASTSAAIGGTPNGVMYQTERFGVFSYNFPVPNGQYAVVLHFAETYWSQAGQRVFSVAVEGAPGLTNYDIVRKVGPLTATTETLAATVADGSLTLAFTASVDQPKVSSIEVLPAGGQSSNRVGGAQLAGPATGDLPAGLQVYPTPGAGPFTVAVTVATAQAATLQLLDGLGRVVQRQTVQLRAGANKLPFAGPGAAHGLYQLVLVGADGQRQAQKVLITP